MSKHNPTRILVPVLLTCNLCHGEETIDGADGELNWCNACHNGYIALAVNSYDLLATNKMPVAQGHAYLLERAQPVLHPLLYTVTQTPDKYQRPLRLTRPVKDIR